MASGPFAAMGAMAGAVMSIIGNLIANGDRDAAMRLREQAMQEFNIQLPELHEIEAQQVHTRPEDAQAQRDVYSELLAQGRSGELRPQDKAKLNEALNATAAQERGARGAITSNMAARGMSGGGSELAAELEAQQAGAQRASNEGVAIAGQSADAAQEALLRGAQLAGTVRGQDLSEGEYNAGARERANVFNVGQHNTRLGQEMDLATARARGFGNMADAREGRADSTQQVWGGVGQAMNAAAGGMAQMPSSVGSLTAAPGQPTLSANKLTGMAQPASSALVAQAPADDAWMAQRRKQSPWGSYG